MIEFLYYRSLKELVDFSIGEEPVMKLHEACRCPWKPLLQHEFEQILPGKRNNMIDITYIKQSLR